MKRKLTLGADDTLNIEPVPAIEAIRFDHQHCGETLLPANREIPLEGIAGNTVELALEIDPQDAFEGPNGYTYCCEECWETDASIAAGDAAYDAYRHGD